MLIIYGKGRKERITLLKKAQTLRQILYFLIILDPFRFGLMYVNCLVLLYFKYYASKLQGARKLSENVILYQS